LKVRNYIAALFLIPLIASCGAPGIKTAANAEEQFALAKKEYDKKRYLKAIEGFQKTIFNFPGASSVDTAQYYLAMSYYENEDFELAAVEFNRLIANYPQSEFIDDAQYMGGVCYFRNTPKHYALDQEDIKRAISAMEDFIVDNPDSPLLDDARNIILMAKTRLAHKEYENGLLYYKMSAYQAAAIYFQLVIDSYTETEYAPKALFKLAEANYKQGKYLEAQEKFNNFIVLYPSDPQLSKAREYLEKLASKLNTANVSAIAK
jgi:outer membrane protein assembly factor BamD